MSWLSILLGVATGVLLAFNVRVLRRSERALRAAQAYMDRGDALRADARSTYNEAILHAVAAKDLYDRAQRAFRHRPARPN